MSPTKPISSLKVALLVLAILAGTGCGTVSSPPRPQESEYFHTRESGFHISAREGTVRYTAVLELNAPLDKPLFLDIQYQNPADPEAPHAEASEWSPEEKTLHLTSPPLQGIEADKIYRVEVTIFEDPDRTETLDTHEILILSNIETRRHNR